MTETTTRSRRTTKVARQAISDELVDQRLLNTSASEGARRKRDPHPVSALVRGGKTLTASAALTTCLAALLKASLLRHVSAEVLGAAAALAAIAIAGFARWINASILVPFGESLPCLVRRWVRNWDIDRQQANGVLTPKEALGYKRKLFEESLAGRC